MVGVTGSGMCKQQRCKQDRTQKTENCGETLILHERNCGETLILQETGEILILHVEVQVQGTVQGNHVGTCKTFYA